VVRRIGLARRTRRHLLAAALGGAAALSATGCAAPQSDGPAGVEIKSTGTSEFVGGTAIRTSLPLPDVDLTDTAGAPFNPSVDTAAPVTLVFFGYTNCPDVCYTTLANTASAIRKLDSASQSDIQMMFITVDPERDTPPVVAAYMDRFGFPSYVGLTGDLPAIESAASSLHIGLDKHRRLPDGGYEVPHSVQVIGFDANRSAKVFWSDGTPTADLAHDLEVLASASK
jgi:protein SCO1/2